MTLDNIDDLPEFNVSEFVNSDLFTVDALQNDLPENFGQWFVNDFYRIINRTARQLNPDDSSSSEEDDDDNDVFANRLEINNDLCLFVIPNGNSKALTSISSPGSLAKYITAHIKKFQRSSPKKKPGKGSGIQQTFQLTLNVLFSVNHKSKEQRRDSKRWSLGFEVAPPEFERKAGTASDHNASQLSAISREGDCRVKIQELWGNPEWIYFKALCHEQVTMLSEFVARLKPQEYTAWVNNPLQCDNLMKLMQWNNVSHNDRCLKDGNDPVKGMLIFFRFFFKIFFSRTYFFFFSFSICFLILIFLWFLFLLFLFVFFRSIQQQIPPPQT